VKPITLGSIFSVAVLALASSAFASAPLAPVSLGDNTWSITREAGSAFNRDVDKLKAEATDAATKFCADQGKQMKLISLTGKLPMFSLGYANAKIVFKALNPGDPELAAPATVQGAPAQVVYAPVEKRLTTDELYDELVKLDDLRKKGILTDDEFQAEKKKLLSRSN
jgi:Short C-terminal domain